MMALTVKDWDRIKNTNNKRGPIFFKTLVVDKISSFNYLFAVFAMNGLKRIVPHLIMILYFIIQQFIYSGVPFLNSDQVKA